MIFVIVFFGACTFFMGNEAATNEQGLILNGIIEFSTKGATIFYWAIAASSLAFVVLGFLLLIISISSKREIVITEDSITSPKSGLSKQNITVHFSDITGMYIQTVNKTKILNIEHHYGKLSIASSMLPSKTQFDELVSLIQARVNG